MRRRLLSRHFPPLGPSQCRHGPCERCCERHACGCALNSASAAVAAGIDRPAAIGRARECACACVSADGLGLGLDGMISPPA